MVLQCQIWSTNTKLFFWENNADLESFQKFSSHVGVIYKFVLGSIKILNSMLEVIKFCCKVQKCIIWSTNTNLFFLENEANLESFQKSFPRIGVSCKLVLSVN